MSQSIYDVAVIVGSIRKESFSRKLALAMMKLAPANLKLEIVEIREVPMYNQDEDDHPPAASAAFKARVQKANAVLFVTPEYNRSLPGCLKNVIDVGSRPYGQSAWSGKPAAVVSNSPGALGAFGANHALRQSLAFLDMPTMGQPEAYIGNVAQLLDANGNIANDSSRELLSKFMAAFAAWIAQHTGA
jgi:chromate reductase